VLLRLFLCGGFGMFISGCHFLFQVEAGTHSRLGAYVHLSVYGRKVYCTSGIDVQLIVA
jgi:hypothetical protein